MNPKKTVLYTLLPCLILIALFLLILLPKSGGQSGNYTLTGRYAETPSGQHIIYRNTDTGEMRYVFLLPKQDASMFDGFETGDAIQVQAAPRIEEADEDIFYVEVWAPKKSRNLTDIPMLTDEVLAYIETLDVKFSP